MPRFVSNDRVLDPVLGYGRYLYTMRDGAAARVEFDQHGRQRVMVAALRMAAPAEVEAPSDVEMEGV